MSASDKAVKPYHYAIIGLWLLGIVIASRYFIDSRLVTFDPQQKLTGLSNERIVEQVSHIKALAGTDLRNTIVHFTTPGCSCDQFSVEHKAGINYQAKLDGFKVINLELDPTQSSLIPSSPAVLVLDELGKLIYLGPYSIGLSCTQSNGYIELALANYKKGFNSKLIINQASGCYCNI